MCLSPGSTVHLLLQIEPCAGPDASIEAMIKDGNSLLLSCADYSAGLNYGPGTQQIDVLAVQIITPCYARSFIAELHERVVNRYRRCLC